MTEKAKSKQKKKEVGNTLKKTVNNARAAATLKAGTKEGLGLLKSRAGGGTAGGAAGTMASEVGGAGVLPSWCV